MYQSNLLISFHHQNAHVHRFSCPQVPIVIQIYQYISSQPFHFSAWFAFLLPCYSTFKVLSHQPVSEPDIQKWAMYWSVIGAFVAFEYLAEWLISWQVIFPPLAPCDHLTLALLPSRLPFYWELKTAFLLFLSLPQTGPPVIRPKVGSQKTRFLGFLSVPNFKISVRKRSDICPISEVSSRLGSDLYRSKFFYFFGTRRHSKLLEMVLRALPPDFHDSPITCGECA